MPNYKKKFRKEILSKSAYSVFQPTEKVATGGAGGVGEGRGLEGGGLSESYVSRFRLMCPLNSQCYSVSQPWCHSVTSLRAGTHVISNPVVNVKRQLNHFPAHVPASGLALLLPCWNRLYTRLYITCSIGSQND
ncbi:hypothetical protein BaRGS_00018285 [Batillaria attramentaria]|uniref:Uncharacterized protein n=1 Tax=Batillaria attramentaria TaxID=370345 RepID=A0ABD0KTI9_9CAEN